jgi:hypothetical protein
MRSGFVQQTTNTRDASRSKQPRRSTLRRSANWCRSPALGSPRPVAEPLALIVCRVSRSCQAPALRDPMSGSACAPPVSDQTSASATCSMERSLFVAHTACSTRSALRYDATPCCADVDRVIRLHANLIPTERSTGPTPAIELPASARGGSRPAGDRHAAIRPICAIWRPTDRWSRRTATADWGRHGLSCEPERSR